MNVTLAPPVPALDSIAEHAAHEELLGRWDSSAHAFSRLFRTALGQGEMVRAVNALRGQARVRREQGRFEEAGELAELSRVIAELHGLTLESARALNVLGIIRYAEGRWADAETLYDRALSLAIDVGDDELVGLVCLNQGVLANVQGKLRDARIHYLESIGSSVRSGNKRNELTAYNNLGFVCGELGEWLEAGVYFDRAVEIAERVGDSAHMASVLANRALPLIQVGELARARETLQRAEEAALTIQSRVALADIARFRGMLARAGGNHEEARRRFGESLALSTEAGLEHERAKALVELGALNLEEGHGPDATTFLREAYGVFRQLGAVHDARRAELLLQRRSKFI
jgi:tetratricopeptide (TPR) repeat protein